MLNWPSMLDQNRTALSCHGHDMCGVPQDSHHLIIGNLENILPSQECLVQLRRKHATVVARLALRDPWLRGEAPRSGRGPSESNQEAARHGHRQPGQRGGGGGRQRGEHERAALGARQPPPPPRRRLRRAPRPAAAQHRRRSQPRPHPLRRPKRHGGAGVHAGDRGAPEAGHAGDPGARAQDLLREECGGEDGGGGGGSQGEDLRGDGQRQGRSARHGVPCYWAAQEDVLGKCEQLLHQQCGLPCCCNQGYLSS